VSGWSPVIYGRTRVADKWWRALPVGITTGHWVADAAVDTVARGAALVGYPNSPDRPSSPVEPENTPRFAFVRKTGGSLVGLACRARLLSSELCQDQFGREIYCFVGWFTLDPKARDIPAPADLIPAASQVYQQYSAPVWTTEPTTLRVQESAVGPAPWPHPASHPEQGAELSTVDQRVMIYPAAMAQQLWCDGIGSSGPFVLVTGWQQARQASLERITHLSADNIATPITVSRPLPRRESDDRAQPSGPTQPSGENQERPREQSYLASSPLARQYQAAQQEAKDRSPNGCVLSFGRIVELVRQLTGSPPLPEHRTSASVQRAAQSPSGQATTEDPASAAEAPNTRPDIQEPPQSLELPPRRRTAKPFEGLE
jgi:hypothetical protein